MAVYASQVHGNLLVTGGIYGLTDIEIPAGLLTDTQISAVAAISASKCERSLRAIAGVAGQVSDGTTIPLAFFIKGTAATFKHMTCTNRIACAGSSSLTCDVKKNGTSILSSAETLDSGTAAYSENEGSISTTTGEDGDYITFEIVATQSGSDALAYGVFIQLDYDEDYAN